MDLKVLQTQQLTGGWWKCGLGKEKADLKRFFFPPFCSNSCLHGQCPLQGGTGESWGGTRGRMRRGSEDFAARVLLAGFIHG